MKTKLFNYLNTLIMVGLAVWAAVSLYRRYVEHPWTRDGQVASKHCWDRPSGIWSDY
jgi:multidrug resistance efflux pump